MRRYAEDEYGPREPEDMRRKRKYDRFMDNGEFAPVVDLDPWGELPFYRNAYHYICKNMTYPDVKDNFKSLKKRISKFTQQLDYIGPYDEVQINNTYEILATQKFKYWSKQPTHKFCSQLSLEQGPILKETP